jgi:ABC-type phosphate transport system permease subunit
MMVALILFVVVLLFNIGGIIILRRARQRWNF